MHALVDVRDRSKNSMARVAAAKALEDVAEAAERVPLGGAARTPGVVIIIGGEPIAGLPLAESRSIMRRACSMRSNPDASLPRS